MKDQLVKQRLMLAAACSAAGLISGTAIAQDKATAQIEEIVVLGQRKTYSAVSTTESMIEQQNPITSINATIDNLPGVNVTEGDTFGFDDWSTTINLRGYQTSLSDQQVGTTIDGMPNGDSGYGGGAKANRYIDSMNLGGVEVNQGIADISSRSTEALGGTLNYLTSNPLQGQRMRLQTATGDFDSQRYYGRYDTGRVLGDSTVAWISINHNEATDWMEGSAENERDHAALKFISNLGMSHELIGYLSYDDTHEDNYQRVTPAEFAEDSDWDRLIGTWTDIPYVNQVYRRGWSTLRENKFGYLKLNSKLSDQLSTSVGFYKHDMVGRGDWIPPYLANVVDDAGGRETELGSSTRLGGSQQGAIFFVDANGSALQPSAGCSSSITFPYGGAGAVFDPACYPANAIPVQSYRHTNYERDRMGLTADFELINSFGEFDNSLRGGFWFEDSLRSESRSWHKLADARVGIDFNETPYWIQYDREYQRDTMNWYLQDTLSFMNFSFNLGLRQFEVDNEVEDQFGVDPSADLTSDSDTLFSGGATYSTPIDGLEVFFGYAENIKPLTDYVLERGASAVATLEAETAENLELGVRFVGERLTASAVFFDNKFENRIQFFDPNAAEGIPNYDIGLTGFYKNVGGVEADGLELAGSLELTENWSVYGSYTLMEATYLGTGSAEDDVVAGVFPGNAVVNTADDMFVVSIDWARDNYAAGLSTKFVGDRFIDLANTKAADDYMISDFYMNVTGELSGDALKGYKIGITINNIFDESYLGGISGWGAWIGAPRTAVFDLTLDF
ncbi:TonB-dependent receptor [Proteobacteria bacterium 005FR1]|nr:TonB-dependent receptor [Proteobacteria bacterium 005FR1]